MREKYGRLMLILFKPWRTVQGLRHPQYSWAEVFDNYLPNCLEKWKTVMNNMQVLHECRDSHDDHFAKRRDGQRNCANVISPELVQGNSYGGFEYDMEGEEEEVILKHFESMAGAQLIRDST